MSCILIREYHSLGVGLAQSIAVSSVGGHPSCPAELPAAHQFSAHGVAALRSFVAAFVRCSVPAFVRHRE